jgi:tellurite resistance protein TerC
VKIRRALCFVALWVGLAMLFNLGIYLLSPYVSPESDNRQLALEFLGGYVTELSLSLDNLFVFLMVFTAFNVPSKHQRRALNYGIAGAMVLRLAFILLGTELVSQFRWLLYVFGGVLIISGVMMLLKGEKEKDYKQSRVLTFFSKALPFTGRLEGEKFIVKRNGRRYATLLLAVLVIIETSDIIFAVDSIPAILSFTLNRFIIYTSNIFAILGLRSFYFVLERLSQMFRFVKYGVAIILMFTGVKLCGEMFELKIPIVPSICVIVGVLFVSILASMLVKEKGPSEGNA